MLHDYPSINVISANKDGEHITAMQFNGIDVSKPVTTEAFDLSWNLYQKSGTVLRRPLVKVKADHEEAATFLESGRFRIAEGSPDHWQPVTSWFPAQLNSLESGQTVKVFAMIDPAKKFFLKTPVLCFSLSIQSSQGVSEIGARRGFPAAVGGNPKTLAKPYHVGVKIIAR